MKWIFFLSLIALSICTSCDREKEDFTPYPGGKCCPEEPKE